VLVAHAPRQIASLLGRSQPQTDDDEENLLSRGIEAQGSTDLQYEDVQARLELDR
jgi:hypothetical protein